ncbi:hypothetical protein E7V67_006300 [[Empedobacter] haloabium]|uniref:DNA transfer protein n=1 Tax=[Empedobacter] haloabium TaxID=592317 RepID=A0ABZ1UPR9_9BURK
MGLLADILSGNASPEVSAGLLAMGTKMMQASGPSRLPVNTMQALGLGAQAFQQGRDDYLDQQRQKQMQDMQFKLYGLKLQDAEGEHARNTRILERLQNLDGVPKLRDNAPQAAGAGGLDTSYNGTPYSHGEAQAAFSAASAAGMSGYDPVRLNQIMALSRQGMSADQAAQRVFGSAPQPMAAGAPPGPASIFAADDGAQFPSTTALLAGLPGLPGLPKRQDDGAAPAGQQLPFLPPTIQQGGAVPRQNATQQAVQRMLARADIYASEGDHASAAKIYADVAKFQPQVDRIDIATHEGKPVRVITYKDGREEVSQYGAKPDIASLDLGDAYELYDKNTAQPGRLFQKRQTPDSRAVDRRFAARAAAGMGSGGEQSIDNATLDVLADQALSGDTSVYQNFGRGAQGAANLIKLRARVAQKAVEKGLTGGDLASINADYQGQKAGLRTSGTISARIENAASEAAELAPLAIQASRNVARSGLLPFGKADVMFDTQTNDPAMSQFATANIGLATAYAGAMARGGKATVSDMQHAREILSTAKSQTAYEATVSQMQQEIAAAQRAPQNVRNNLRSQINGRGGSHDTPTVPNPMAAEQFTVTAPNGKTYTFPDRKAMNNFKLSTGIK